ncbi:MAG TPA: SDR family oxidoreductase [Thermoanaerobaculia bacterium]|jgi:NAD(P)-dependent dehydrogenase (short-subunit alcohol dehydrogenase family)
MKLQLKSLPEQVLVITGASSGIGLVTAKMAAEEGARVVLASRNENDLETAVEDIRHRGGEAVYVVADVADPGDVEKIADAAVRAFGRIDTWVNNAGVALYGPIMDLDLEDMRRQFDVLYWGVVHGCRTAVPHLAQNGGALINVASVLADRSVPLQGNYSAAKHAVKGFTDALRMELEAEGLPISVTLIKPTSIDTPLFDKAKTLLEVEPQPVPPVYAPEIVARAILDCAQKSVRELNVGGAGRAMTAATGLAPRISDLVLEKTGFEKQKSDIPASHRDNLFAPLEHDGGERGRNWRGRVKETSVYTRAALHPGTAALAALGIGAGLLAGARALRSRKAAAEVGISSR